MPAIAGMFLVSEEGLVNPGCCRSTCLSAAGLPFFHFQPRLTATPLGSFLLSLPFGWPSLRFALGFFLSLTLGFLFRLALGFFLSLTLGFLLSLALGLFLGLFLGFLLHLALGLFLGLTLGFPLRLAFCLLFSLLLCFSLRLAFSSFLLRLTLSDLTLRCLLACYLALLRDLSLRSFFTRLLLGSHNFLRVGYPALSIYNRTEKSSKSSDAVNIFEIAFFG